MTSPTPPPVHRSGLATFLQKEVIRTWFACVIFRPVRLIIITVQ